MTSGRREAAARALGAAGSCAIRVTTSRNASESPRRAASRNPMGPSSLSHRPARSAPKTLHRAAEDVVEDGRQVAAPAHLGGDPAKDGLAARRWRRVGAIGGTGGAIDRGAFPVRPA